MEAEHLLTVPSSASGGPSVAVTASSVGLYGPEVVVATASVDNRLYLHRPFLTASAAREISWSAAPHSGTVEQLSFSASSSPLQLASASRDCIILWQLEGALPLSPGGAPPCKMAALSPLSGSMVCICLSSYIALCVGCDVLLFTTQNMAEEGTLQGHLAPITHGTFHPHHSHTLVTTSQDRTFKVWDVVRGTAIYQSSVMSSLPLTCVAVDATNEILAVTTDNGKLWLLDMSPRGSYRPLLACEVWRERDRHLASSEEGEREEEVAEPGTAVLGLHFWSSHDQREDPLISGSLVMGVERLLVIGHTSIMSFDPNTLRPVELLEFRDPVSSMVSPPTAVLPVACSSAMITCTTDNQVYCVLSGMFERTVSLLTLTRPLQPKIKTNGQEKALSFLSCGPLVANSPLRSEFIPKPRPSTVKSKPSVGARKTKGGGAVTDKPLTFRSKVKSSGYTASPRMKMFAPTVASGSTKKPKSSSQTQSRERRVYRLERGAPANLLCRIQPLVSPAPLTSLCCSGDGQYVACGAADKATYLLKLPPSQKRIQAFTGHDGTVHSVDWSRHSDLLLTGSADGTAKLWTPAQREPLLTISHTHSSTQTRTSTAGSRFPAGISRAMFYHLDEFLLLSSSNSLHLFKYHIDTRPLDDIRRYLNQSGYKLVQTLPMEEMHSITCLAAINHSLSYLVVVGGSNKSVDILDMNVGRRVRSMTDCHSRPPHWASINKGSEGVAHPSWAYDLFLTSAPTDGVKLWDLRSNRCVRCLSAHINRCHSVTAEFSPCSRFIATGSEDKSAYIYDLRTLSPLHKLSGHSDTVTSVSFHPLTPMLVTATLDGKVTFFTSDTKTL